MLRLAKIRRKEFLRITGPQKYTGKSMADSHAHLKITAEEWEAFLDDFQQTLDKFAVPAVEQGELKAIVNSTRADIVVASAPRAEVASFLGLKFFVRCGSRILRSWVAGFS